MLQCPSCKIGILLLATVDYPIGDTLIKDVPALTCTCGENILAEDVLSEIMAYIQKDKHLTTIEWGELNASSSR